MALSGKKTSPIRRFPHTVPLALIVLLAIQIGLCLWFASHKAGLFQDESYTFFLANGWWLDSSPQQGFIYHDGEPWHSWTSVQSFLGIDFSKLYLNQASDNHPPLYYLLFSFAYSLFPGSSDPIIGCALNTIFSVISTLLVYALARQLGTSEELALGLSFIWAINPGMINSMLYLRMYCLLTVFFLAASVLAIRSLSEEALSWATAIALFSVSVAGFLTQYFFVLFAFPLYLICGICLLVRGRAWCAAKFAGATVGGIACAVAIFPPSIGHLLASGRGKEALGRAATGDSFLAFFKQDWHLLNTTVFGGILPGIVAITLALTLIAVMRGRHRGSKLLAGNNEPKHLAGGRAEHIRWGSLAILAAASITFVTAVARVAPFASIRYLMAVNPVLIIVVMLLLHGSARAMLEGSRGFSKGAALGLACVLASGVLMSGVGFSLGIKYFHQQNDAVAALANKNDAMVVAYTDQVFLEAMLPEGIRYKASAYFTSEAQIEEFDAEELGGHVTVFLQPGLDYEEYVETIKSSWDAELTYVGDSFDGYAAYDAVIRS